MAASFVYSFDFGEQQSVSWSEDDRIAISADREIIIMKLDISPRVEHGFRILVKVSVSSSDLPERQHIWTGMNYCLQHASQSERSSFLKKWSYSSLTNEDQISTAWSQIAWSSVGVGLDNRSVLAALTRDHHIFLYGHSKNGLKWIQLADLGNQLIQYHHHDFVSEYECIKSHAEHLTVIYNQMLKVAAVELLWSSVLKDPEISQAKFVLLFVAMKNGDIVIWKNYLPLAGIESCNLLSRQAACTKSTVTSLSWTALPDDKDTGLLAVGYANGCLELHCFCFNRDTAADQKEHKCRQMLYSHSDQMPISCSTWITTQQVNLMLLCTKEQVTFVYSIIVNRPVKNRMEKKQSGKKKNEDEWNIKVTGSSHARLGNWLPASGMHCMGNTVVMSAEDGNIFQLSVSGSVCEPKVLCVKKLLLHLDEPEWGCVGMQLSPNAQICLALFKPNFAFNHRLDRFRLPSKMHMCLVHTLERSTLEQMLAADKVSSIFYTDMLEFARHALCMESVTQDIVGDMIQRFKTSPYIDTAFGLIVGRYLLTMLCAICKREKLTSQVEMVEAAFESITEILLCQHIRSLMDTVDSSQKQIFSDQDLSSFNTMLNWIQSSNKRIELVGSVIIYNLTSAIGHPQPDICILCDSEMKFTKTTEMMCAERHSFGLCCHSLSVCNTVPCQCCSICGALALPERDLKRLNWLTGNLSSCTLCGSFMCDTNSNMNF